MAVTRVRGEQLDIIDITSDIAADATAIGNIATGVVSDAGAKATLDGVYQIKVVPGTVGDFAALNASGELVDGGVQASDLATAAQGALADSALQDVVDDTTPQLGGDLDTNGNNIVTGASFSGITTADATGTNDAEDLNFYTGNGGGTSGDSGSIVFLPGSTTNGKRGDFTVNIQSSTGANPGGAISLSSGQGGVGGGDGGDIDLTARGANGAGNNAGGDITLLAGDSIGTPAGGLIDLTAGNGATVSAGGAIGLTAGNGGVTSGAGGAIDITAGDGGGGASAGGAVDINGGAGGGFGGAINITAGSPTVDGDGADIVLTPGSETGGNSDGAIIIAQTAAPSVTTNKLYNVAGVLTWNGSATLRASDIGSTVLAQQTIGIADDNLLEVDGTPAAAEYARFTANGLEGRTEAEFKADFNLEDGVDVQAPTPTATTTELADITNAINTTVLKVAGYMVFNTTTGAPVWAIGAADGSVWNDATGTLAHTPV
jgi:hypothetical protein